MPDELWDPGIKINDHLRQILIASSDIMDNHGNGENEESRTELDSHANMPVVGRHALVIADTGKTVSVCPFTPDYQALNVKMVDAAVQYDCPYTGTSYILIINNAIHVPSMTNNLLPPFILRENGIQVSDVPKIHVSNPTTNDHAILFPETGFKIPLSLWGVFSYFPTSKPTTDEMNGNDEIYMLTPARWNPHCDSYARNEESMLDWSGNMTSEKERKRIVLSEIDDDSALAASMTISDLEHLRVNQCIEQTWDMDNTPEQVDDQIVQPPSYENASVLAGISLTLDPTLLYEKLAEKVTRGKFSEAIGATTVSKSKYLVETVNDEESVASEENDSEEKEDEEMEDVDETFEDELDDLFTKVQHGTIDIDAVMASAATATPQKDVDAEHLAKIWRIDLEAAKRTLDVTTQHRKHTLEPQLARNYSSNDRMLRYKRINEHFFMDTFFATKKAGKSTRGHTCCQLFVTDKGFVYVVPMRTKGDVLQAVKQFAKEIGAPDAIISDSSGEQRSFALRKFCNEIGTTLRALEQGTPWANRAELYIGLMKEATRKDMKDADCPVVFWDYCLERRVRINNLTAKNLFQLHGTNAHTATLHDEADISNICRYGWYDWCYFMETTAKFPFQREVLGRVLGPARGEGNEMAQWILNSKGNVVPRRSLRPLRQEELRCETEATKRKLFDELIKRRWGDAINPPKKESLDHDDEDLIEDSSLEEEDAPTPSPDSAVDATGMPINQQPFNDGLLNAEVRMNVGNDVMIGKVKRRATNANGSANGTYDQNPLLNTMVYEVEFEDGTVSEYAANSIAENMLRSVDDEGYSTTLMEGIVDWKRDDAVAVMKNDGYLVTGTGTKRRRKSTQGWKLLVHWKDDTESWVSLKEMKESHPVQVAEFAKARGIDDEPAFAWWVPYTLRKRDVILASVKLRVRKTTHKYGIEVPVDINQAIEIDRKNGDRMWQDAVALEMVNVGVAFEVLEEQRFVPIGWRKVTGHIIFDVKMDFTRKARWVLDGHKTPDPSGSTYAGVVSRESVRIAFTYAALNGLQVCAADIRNAYLQAPSSQKDYVICGPEFGLENVGKPALIHRALYGGKTAGRDFRNHLRACMHQLGYSPCLADPDVWMRPGLRSDGSECNEYILLYVDDALAIGVDAEKMLRNEVGKYFELKPDSVGPPKLYLGGRMSEVVLDNGVRAWSISSSQYVQNAVKNVEKHLAEQGLKLPNKADTPIQTSYRPELDVTDELSPKDAGHYQSLIGVLRWICELGRVDICLEVSMLSSHLALPRSGHLTQVLHIFAYLRRHHNAELVLDPSDPVINMEDFEKRDWTSSEFGHVIGVEEVPKNMPRPRGFGFVIRGKVDADHAGDTTSRRSRTGFIVYLNCAPCYWLSKKQTSVESSSFGSEFVAMKQCCEYIRGLRYKLRMMGIPVEGPAFIYGDNQSVLANSTIPDSTLKKKSQSICYHFVREGAARDEWRTTYVNTHDNEADLLTKVLPHGEKRKGFVRCILHHVFDE